MNEKKLKPTSSRNDFHAVGGPFDPATGLRRSELWSDVSRDKKPPLGVAGRLAHRARWFEIYNHLSKVWEERGDIEMALYWAERAKEKE